MRSQKFNFDHMFIQKWVFQLQLLHLGMKSLAQKQNQKITSATYLTKVRGHLPECSTMTPLLMTRY